MTIVCDISAKDLLSQLNFFFRSNWKPSKNSINIHFSSYFYSIQAAGIGLWGFAKEIAGDLIHYWNQNWLLSNTLQTLWKKNPHTYKEWETFFPQYFKTTFDKLMKSVMEQIELWWISFSPSFCGIVCKISAKNSLSLLKFLAGGNSMLAKNSIKAARGLAFISMHTLIFNVRGSDWFGICRLNGRGFSLLKPNYVPLEQTPIRDFWKKN